MVLTDLIGQRFGMLTVTEDSGRRQGRSILWRCRCDCGGEACFTRGQLTSGAVVNCGCQKIKHSTSLDDLTGRQFGRLTVLRREENDRSGKTRWLCRCACGSTCVVLGQNLKHGSTCSCGCRKKDTVYLRRDLTGQRFGRLTALCPVKRDGRSTSSGTVWRCRCDCGQEADVPASCLVSGRTRSCGCLNREQMSRMHEHMHYDNGTCVERLVRAQKNGDHNKAGFRGLFLTKDGRYRVTISFQKARYNLGYYRDYAEAVRVRLDAEQTLHQGYIDAHERAAAADPAWAKENPFVYEVHRADGQFIIHSTPLKDMPA